MKRGGVSPAKRLRKEIDSIFSMFTRIRDKRRFGGLCVLCKTRPIEVCFHFLSRGNLKTRWNTDNSCGSCRGCNFNEAMDRKEVRKDFWKAHHIALVGIVTRETVEKEAHEIVKYDLGQLIAIRDNLKARLELVCRQ